jgi:hypothetical protein
MPLFVSCPICKKRFRLEDLLEAGAPAASAKAGEARKFTCPACGTKFREVVEGANPKPTPSDTDVMKPEVAFADAKGPVPTQSPTRTKEADGPKRKGKRRRKRKAPKRWAWLSQTVFIAAGIRLTPLRLALAGVLLIALVWLGISFIPFGAGKPTARGVEIVQSRFQVFKVDSPQIPQGSQLFLEGARDANLIVMRPHSESDTILVTFPISKDVQERTFGNKSMIAKLALAEVQLLSDDRVIKPICFLELQLNQEGANWYYRRSKDGAVVGGLVGPPSKLNAASQRLTFQRDTGGWKVQSDTGMTVDFTIDAEADKALVTWDGKSTGWKATATTQNPSQIGWTWEVKCLFPRPPKVNNMQIKVWNEAPRPLVWSGE